MTCSIIYITITLLGLTTLASTKPIMVSFGTNQGPIVPRQKSSTLTPRNLVARSPAPVSEDREDVPNPNVYTPLVPHQYRNKILSYQVPSNLVLGTPIDQRYTPSLQKYDIYKKAQSRSLGLDYTGPHIFETQAYEFDIDNKKTTLQPSVSYIKPHYFQKIQENYDLQNNKYVPQIGVIYSGGVRYYIPQIVHYNKNQEIQNQKDANSVYDNHDEKYFHRANQQ